MKKLSLVAFLVFVFATFFSGCAPVATPKTGDDGMILVYVPAGEFTMGTDNPYVDPNITPAHKIMLDAFWIDKTEVTNKMFATCVTQGGCKPPGPDNKGYGDPKFNNYPVNDVLWLDANDYCAWAGRRLPTEAEWEKAARGTDERNFPWGNSSFKAGLIVNGASTTQAVGSSSIDSSPYGALDMFANVREWVADWYNEAYFQNSPSSNPLGPTIGEYNNKVIRGHSNQFVYTDSNLLDRSHNEYDWWNDARLGFRCAVGESIPFITVTTVLPVRLP